MAQNYKFTCKLVCASFMNNRITIWYIYVETVHHQHQIFGGNWMKQDIFIRIIKNCPLLTTTLRLRLHSYFTEKNSMHLFACKYINDNGENVQDESLVMIHEEYFYFTLSISREKKRSSLYMMKKLSKWNIRKNVRKKLNVIYYQRKQR